MAKHHNSHQQSQPQAAKQPEQPSLLRAQEQASAPIQQSAPQSVTQTPQQTPQQGDGKRLYVVKGCDIDGLDGRLYREGDRVSLSPSSIPANVKHLLREIPQGGK